jgi:hypothetical protein
MLRLLKMERLPSQGQWYPLVCVSLLSTRNAIPSRAPEAANLLHLLRLLVCRWPDAFWLVL